MKDGLGRLAGRDVGEDDLRSRVPDRKGTQQMALVDGTLTVFEIGIVGRSRSPEGTARCRCESIAQR